MLLWNKKKYRITLARDIINNFESKRKHNSVTDAGDSCRRLPERKHLELARLTVMMTFQPQREETRYPRNACQVLQAGFKMAHWQ